MTETMSATDARINFGKVMRLAAEKGQPIVVEKAGKPQVVILSIERYEQLMAAQTPSRDDLLLMRAKALRNRVQARLGDRALPLPEDVIEQMREERTDELADLR